MKPGRSFLVFISIFTISTTCFCAPATDQLTNAKCSFVSMGKHVCRISMRRLYVSANKFNARTIQVLGYLAIDNGRLALYVSKESYELAEQDSSIVIDVKYAKERELANKFAFKYVLLTGNFDARKSLARRLGEFNSVDLIYSVEQRPDVPEDHQIFRRNFSH